jgi:hypothetical protein
MVDIDLFQVLMNARQALCHWVTPPNLCSAFSDRKLLSQGDSGQFKCIVVDNKSQTHFPKGHGTAIPESKLKAPWFAFQWACGIFSHKVRLFPRTEKWREQISQGILLLGPTEFLGTSISLAGLLDLFTFWFIQRHKKCWNINFPWENLLPVPLGTDPTGNMFWKYFGHSFSKTVIGLR